MGWLIVDEEKCVKDGICVEECPFGIIEMDPSTGYPILVSGGETICNGCGHCVAICPYDALSHKYVLIDESPLIEEDRVISEAQVRQLLRARRSIRRFKQMAVEKEKLEGLIDIARYAPNARNAQLLEWLVITDKTELKILSKLTVDWMRDDIEKNPDNPRAAYFPRMVAGWEEGKDMILWDAPALIFVSAPKEAPFGLVDLSIALSYLELTAPTMGLGTCWAGLLEGALLFWPPARDALGITRERPYHYPMMIGYPAPSYHRLPQRKKPKITWR